ncbi:MAG TPA: hypothetical protein VHP33_33305 [Polyangiaceae bacterium]|nr:hypothetical protein [Polyangiaceae bacterium]
MKRFISALALVSAAALGVAGCGGDDDDDTNGAAGKGNTGGEPGSNGGEPGSDGGTPASTGGAPANTGGAPTDNVSCDETQDGVCQNPMDCPFVVDGTARITAGTCGKGCLASSDENCAVDCILEELAMSSECAKCYADTVACTVMKCLAECVSDPEAEACKLCQVEKGCRDAFNECSGLPE